MDALVADVQNLAAVADESDRQKLLVTLRDLSSSIETPSDTYHRFGYLHLQTAMVRLGFDLNIFKTIIANKPSVTVHQIQTATGADEIFLCRYLTYLASIGVVKEVSGNVYAANKVTENLSDGMTVAGICHCFETIGPQFQELPRFMRETQFQNPDDPRNTVFQTAWKSNLHQFEWFKTQPDKLKFFNNLMALRRSPDSSWLSVYPVVEEALDWRSESPVYVNIGGGIGHQCAQFREKYPQVPGRVILQDLPHTIEMALKTPGVENMAHNMFEPQPIHGAKFYYFRHVLHNHPDDKVRLILTNIRSSMSRDSIILLDEWVMPGTDVTAYAAAMDLTMMAAFASMERTEEQWRALLSSVGLTLVQSYGYNSPSYETVMDVRVR